MSLVVRRVATVIRRYGESFASGGAARRGVFSPLATGQLQRLFPRYVVDSFARPVHSVVVPASDPTPTGGTVVWRGASYAVRAVYDHALRGVTVAKELVIEPV